MMVDGCNRAQSAPEDVPSLSDGSLKSQASGQESEPPLGHAFFRVVRAVMFEEVPQPELTALPLAQLRLLWTIYFLSDATMKDYSERLGVSQSTVTQLAERLVRRGMVLRQMDASDRRLVRLQLTPMGRQVMTTARTVQQQTFQQLWELLSAKDREQVMQGLEILGDAGERVRAAQGRPLPPLPPPSVNGQEQTHGPVERAQPVMDLMARRVRGGSA